MMTTAISSVLGGGRRVWLSNCIVKHQQQHNHHSLDWSSNNNNNTCHSNNSNNNLSSSSRYMMKGRRMRKRSSASGLWKAIINPMNIMRPRNMDDITSASPSAPPVFRFQFPTTTTTTTRRKKASAPLVMVRFNRRPGGLGGGGWWKEESGKILGNVGVALALAYLSFTGQLGWILDAIVSLWLLAVIVPVVGFGAFLWWASRDMLQGTCPNCRNDFQIFKSMLGDDLQLCPYCTQPFSVVGDKFVQGDINFSSQSQTFDQAFGDFFPPRSKKGSDSSTAVVDVEAEITDAD